MIRERARELWRSEAIIETVRELASAAALQLVVVRDDMYLDPPHPHPPDWAWHPPLWIEHPLQSDALGLAWLQCIMGTARCQDCVEKILERR